MHTKSPSKSDGFTLVEILIVLSIVAVLAAILFAVVGRVRESGRITTCQSNLKQITLAVQQYVADSDGYYPSVTSPAKMVIRGHMAPGYHNAIEPYIKNTDIFSCPSHPDPAPADIVDYSLNWLQLTEFPIRKNIARASHESKDLPSSTTMLLSDQFWTNLDGTTNNGVPFQSSCGQSVGLTNHSYGWNVSFLDGHVKWFSNEQFAEQVECPIIKWRNQNIKWRNQKNK